MLGHDVMSAGLQKYFQRHAFSHTTLNDFTVCLEEALAQDGEALSKVPYDFNLSNWVNDWLKSSGVSTIYPILQITNGN